VGLSWLTGADVGTVSWGSEFGKQPASSAIKTRVNRRTDFLNIRHSLLNAPRFAFSIAEEIWMSINLELVLSTLNSKPVLTSLSRRDKLDLQFSYGALAERASFVCEKGIEWILSLQAQ
jgi:hypothetical protein